ncbi:unnamed protein product [Moneuplotes crassus]|uniref:Uncharacterized protein n=1 Tax=Euplotes crassus TaxID=5936 RepID=A0AAD1XWJ0_EUPCR|nr:unnamed protein product [Moneuplotes crassus]
MLKKLHSNELRLNLATQRKFLNDLYYKLQEDQYVNKKLAANKLVEKLRGTLNDLAKTLALRDKINKEIENQKIKDENEAKAEKAINKIDTNSSALSNADSFLFANTKHISKKKSFFKTGTLKSANEMKKNTLLGDKTANGSGRIKITPLQKQQFATKELEEEFEDKTLIDIAKLEIDDTDDKEAVNDFLNHYISEFAQCIFYMNTVDSKKDFLLLQLLHKISKVIIITEKLAKLAMDGAAPEDEDSSKQLEAQKNIEKISRFSTKGSGIGMQLFNKVKNNEKDNIRGKSRFIPHGSHQISASSGTKDFMTKEVFSSSDSQRDSKFGNAIPAPGFLPNPNFTEKDIQRYDLDSIYIGPQIWDPIFSGFYFMKYEIFIKYLKLSYKIDLPFTFDGKDFNSMNVRESFLVKDDKITLKNYQVWADFFSLGEIITMMCTDLTGDKLAIDEQFRESFNCPHAYAFKIKRKTPQELKETIDPDKDWRELIFMLYNLGLKHISHKCINNPWPQRIFTPKQSFIINPTQKPLNNSGVQYENMSMFDVENDELLYSVKEEDTSGYKYVTFYFDQPLDKESLSKTLPFPFKPVVVEDYSVEARKNTGNSISLFENKNSELDIIDDPSDFSVGNKTKILDGDRVVVKSSSTVVVPIEEIVLKLDKIKTIEMLDWILKQNTKLVKSIFPKCKFDKDECLDYILTHNFSKVEKNVLDEGCAELSTETKHQPTFHKIFNTDIIIQQLDDQKFNSDEVEVDVVLRKSSQSNLFKEDLDIYLQIDSTCMNKFQERLSIFEEMGRIDDMLYETDDFIGVKSKDGDPSVKINRRKELKNYDSFLDSEIE